MTRLKHTVLNIIRQRILLKQSLNLLLNTFYCPSIHPSPEASLSGMMKRWSDAMGPNEIVDVEALLATHYLFAGNFLFDKKHLSVCEIRRPYTRYTDKPGICQRP
jgi:hypothetical protein